MYLKIIIFFLNTHISKAEKLETFRDIGDIWRDWRYVWRNSKLPTFGNWRRKGV